jgi:hypothetical protein
MTEKTILMPHVYLLKFKTQYDLCMSFIRMQEFYESQKFKGKYFTLEEYMDYWSKKFGKGSFTYTSVWNGFNLPGKIIWNWYEKFASIDLRDKEHNLICYIEDLLISEYKGHDAICKDHYDDIYVIGVYGHNSSLAIQHELAHAMYYLNEEYRKNCKKLLKQLSSDIYEECEKWLLDKGYCKSVIKDELQAYFSVFQGQNTNIEDFCMKGRKEFKNNFDEFQKKMSEKIV